MATVSNKFRARYGIESADNVTIQSGGLTVQAGAINLNNSGTLSGVGSTTVVTNLNADLLDGLHSSSFQPIDATLTAIAGVTTAADKLIYFTGVDAAAAADITAFGRSIIGGLDASAGRSTLGLGSIATQAASNVSISGGSIEGTAIGAVTASTGRFSSLTTTGSATVGTDLTVTGNLTVQGDTVSLNVTTLNVEDNEIILNSNVSGTPALDGIITVERGTSANVAIKWDEAQDKWRYTNDGSTWVDMGTATGVVPISLGGTGQTTAVAAFDALAPTTTSGDFIYFNGTDNVRLAPNTGTIKFLSQTSSVPSWYTLTKSDVGLGNVQDVNINTWAGSSNITTLGTITGSAVWSATAIGVSKGGTGLTATPTNGQLPIGNGSGYTLAALTPGTGVTVTNASGSIMLAIGQSVATSATPSFAGIDYVNALDNTGTVTVTSASATSIDSWAVATYTTAEYLVQLKQGTTETVMKVLVLYDGSDVHYTEYARLNSTGGGVDVDLLEPVLNAGNVELRLTSDTAASSNITCKVRRTLIKA